MDYDEVTERDHTNLDIFWLRDKSLQDSEDLPEAFISHRAKQPPEVPVLQQVGSGFL